MDHFFTFSTFNTTYFSRKYTKNDENDTDIVFTFYWTM